MRQHVSYIAGYVVIGVVVGYVVVGYVGGVF